MKMSEISAATPEMIWAMVRKMKNPKGRNRKTVFYDVVPKVRLSKCLKYAINCLDLAFTKAGLRAAKSIASVAATIAVPSSELLQSVDLRSPSVFRFSEGLCPSKTATLGSATDLRTTSTSSLNSA